MLTFSFTISVHLFVSASAPLCAPCFSLQSAAQRPPVVRGANSARSAYFLVGVPLGIEGAGRASQAIGARYGVGICASGVVISVGYTVEKAHV